MAHGGPRPIDVLIANLDFLHDYLVELGEHFRAAGRDGDAEIAEGWASLPIEASTKISELLDR